MLKKILLSLSFVFWALNAHASAWDFMKYFKVDMNIELPDIKEYLQKLSKPDALYDKGYISRYKMGNTFKKEFSQTIKFYGLSEGRIKSYYEDELLEILGWLPKETYQYIGPMLHEVPGMSEKILNLPGIKETKNKFPEKVADRFKTIDDIEYLSPGLYFLLMPEIWDDEPKVDLDQPLPIRVKKPDVNIELPDYLKRKIGVPVKTAEKKKSSAKRMSSVEQNLGIRTIHPNLSSPLTSADTEAFIATIDEIVQWGEENYMENYGKLIRADAILNMWEQENQTALKQNDLKDIVNPCQRLVLKTRFAELYESFAGIVAKQGFSPEEWAYTCDKTIKSFRVAEASLPLAYAIRFHRNGYFKKYIEKLPLKLQNDMYAIEAAIIRMYAVSHEDVEVARRYKDILRSKFNKIDGVMLTVPIFY